MVAIEAPGSKQVLANTRATEMSKVEIKRFKAAYNATIIVFPDMTRKR